MFILNFMVELIGRSKLYDQKKNDGQLASELERVAHDIRWPIDIDGQKLHLSCYFGEPNYSSSKDKDDHHEGLDIQVNAGTEVSAPENSRVIMCQTFDPRGLVGVYLWGQDTGILYVLDHLDSESLPQEIRAHHYFDRYSKLMAKEGEFVGRVANWPLQLNGEVQIPADVETVHGRNYHHLHLETHNYSNGKEPGSGFLGEGVEFNPLLVLRDLRTPNPNQ